MYAPSPAADTALDHRHPALAPLLALGYPSARIDQALAFYDEPHRHYHNRAHVREMLDGALAIAGPPQPEQSLAIVFHDAIYVPGAARGSNEAMSAQLLRVYGAGVPAPVLDLAMRIVIDTADHLPRSESARLVLDLDLLRLAAGEQAFERHSRAVFAEQRPLWPVADDAQAWSRFQRRRIAFFGRLLERPEIFCLPAFRLRYEHIARRNLQRAIAADSA
jgi:predicted metal-dependent HD superfamily phosphohydrolase